MHNDIKRTISFTVRLLLISILFVGTLISQTKTNLEVFYTLIDSTVTQFVFYLSLLQK